VQRVDEVRMLFLHEEHVVIGGRESDFEAAFRDQWLSILGAGVEARLLYFLRQAMGTGKSYRVVTVTAVKDGAAWQRLVQRIHGGDLAAWVEQVDRLRHEVHGKLLVPLPWSPLQDVDLQAVPSTPMDHEPTLFMEDTVWPFEGQMEAYVERSGAHYAREMNAAGEHVLRVEASFRPAFGNHRRREVVLWQKVIQPERLLPLLTRELAPSLMEPGRWMHDALALRDRWESRLLRSVAWSPWH
jgi:hypothetical protein